jgi:peptidoglycan/LPS O-acetylase OafA/YrhL
MRFSTAHTPVTSATTHPKYRPDIDGLRAVAVLSVLFFHSGFGAFSGGYVGVDVFFVISGYLITTIIVREIAAGEFSIRAFYERRFRRILPALVGVVLASLIVGCLLLPPDSVVELGRSAVATALFSSNIFFYLESGYFDAPAELKPLLHTWSLAVEEQYYIFFPLLLLFLARFGQRHYLAGLLVLGLASFMASVLWTASQPSLAFYLIPTRAWELFLGSVLALHVLPAPIARPLREVLTLVGVALIAYSVFVFDATTVFPGSAAAVPTLGAALVIYAGLGGGSVVAAALSWRPVVFVGLISYSLYLWHWPVIVYTKLLTIHEPSVTVIAAMIAVTFVLSILSWRYIETPLRVGDILRKPGSLLRASVLASLAIVVVGLSLVAADGLPGRYEAYFPEAFDTERQRWNDCKKVSDRLDSGRGLCPLGADGAEAQFILWGDSHAESLASGIDLSASDAGVAGVFATESACAPLLHIERPGRRKCELFNVTVLAYIAERPELETVILVGRWALLASGTRYKKESGEPVQLLDTLADEGATSSNEALFELGLRRTVSALTDMGRRVVILETVPEVGFEVPSAYLIAELTGRNVQTLIAPTVAEYSERNRAASSVLASLADSGAVQIIKPATTLCDEKVCAVTARGVPLYRDSNHLSTFGARYLAPQMDPVFSGISGAVGRPVDPPPLPSQHLQQSTP